MKITDEKRYDKAKKELDKKPQSKAKICELLKEALEKGNIRGTVQEVKLSELKNLEIPKTKIDNLNSMLFIQFTRNGYIAVVGAGNDCVKNPLYNKRGKTGEILARLREKDASYKFEFDVDSVIVVLLENVESRGYNKASSILRCRNGLEQYIGEYLESNEVPILNYYQHWNYRKSVKEYD